jgi:cytochrome c-type biogenesis protein CcmH/NrfF
MSPVEILIWVSLPVVLILTVAVVILFALWREWRKARPVSPDRETRRC